MAKKKFFGMHADYVVNKYDKNQDCVCVKEIAVDENGDKTKKLRFFPNYERTFYVTKEKYRKHKEWKEDEDIRRCKPYKATQATLAAKVGKALRSKKGSLRKLSESPYLYGTDVHVSQIIMEKYRDAFGPPTIMPEIAVMDYEWDVDREGKSGSASIGTFGVGNDVHLTIREDKITNCGLTVKEYLHQMELGFEKHVLGIVEEFYKGKIGKKLHKREFKLHIDVVRLDIDVIKKLFSYTHVYKPDFLAFWNGISDLTVIKEHAERRLVELSDFMCDPEVPAEWRVTEVNEGPRGFKIDAKGNKKKVDYFNEWHHLTNFAHWKYVDMMHIYATNRDHLPNLPAYGMDFILNNELKLGKLKLVEEVDQDDMGRWHRIMSSKHIVEYSLYACFDVIGPLLLEDKQHEIAGQFFPRFGTHPINVFKQNPRQLANKMHFELIKDNRIVGSTSSKMTHELDNKIFSGDNWIITLNTHYHDGIGGQALSDSNAYTLWVPQSNDSDLKSSYPMNQRMGNMAKGTTKTEMCGISNMTENDARVVGLNLASGPQNAVLIVTEFLGMPTLQDLVFNYKGHKTDE